MGENAEYVRGFVEAWNRGEADRYLEGDVGAAFEWVPAREHPAATTHRGLEAVQRYLRDWIETVPDMRLEAEELKEANDRVLVLGQMSGRGAGSGAVIEVNFATVTYFRDGTPMRTEEYLDHDEARRVFEAD